VSIYGPAWTSAEPHVLYYTMDDATQGARWYGVFWQQDVMCRTSAGTYQWRLNEAGGGNYWNGGAGGPQIRSIACNVGSTIMGVLMRPSPVVGDKAPVALFNWGSVELPDASSSTYRATSKCVLADGSTQDLVVTYTGPTGGSARVPPAVVPECRSGHAR
jgi:hypothetical protein